MNDLKVLRDACNTIIGHWRCEEINQDYIFHFNDKMLQMAKLTIINDKKFDTEYGLAIDISRGIELGKTNLYFDIGHYDKRYYSILNLTNDLLIVEEFLMKPDTPRGKPLIYKKVKPPDVSDEIFQVMNSN